MTPPVARPLPTAAADPFQSALAEIAETGHLFAVLDGALFRGAGTRLAMTGYDVEPLYLDEASSPAKWTGPLLVWPGKSAEKALRLAGLTRAPASAVWWHWSEPGRAGADSLFRHLRRLNMVELPVATSEDAGSVETVLLRHGDPEVVATLLPLLSLTQLARFLGPADAILLRFTPVLPGDSGIRRLVRPASLPDPAPGMLRLTAAQLQQLSQQRLTREEARVLGYLRRHGGPFLPSVTEGHPDPLPGLTRAWLAEAKGMGVSGERALWKWSLLQLLTEGRMSTDPKVRAFLANATPRHGADRRVNQIMRATISRLRKV